MTSLAEYFAANRPKAKWHCGDRVFGKIQGVPFIGSCGGEIMVNETIGSMVTVFVDLPVKVDNTWHKTFVKVKPKDLMRLKSMDDEELLTLPVAGSIPVKRTKTKNK
jgi:hypothetical protein